MGFRKGDNAPLALVTLLDRSENVAPSGDEEAKGSKKKAKNAEGAAAT